MTETGVDPDPLTADEADDLHAVARYQFGDRAAQALAEAMTRATRRRSGRIDRIFGAGGRLATLTTAGRFTLGLPGGRAVHDAVAPPRWRVTVDAEAAPFVREGETAFAKFVTDVDPAIRPYDEVVIVDAADALLGVGRASLSADGMTAFERGVAVDVRSGREE